MGLSSPRFAALALAQSGAGLAVGLLGRAGLSRVPPGHVAQRRGQMTRAAGRERRTPRPQLVVWRLPRAAVVVIGLALAGCAFPPDELPPTVWNNPE